MTPAPGIPEQPARYDAVLAALKEAGLHARMREMAPRAMRREDLLLVHDPRYLDLAEREIRDGREPTQHRRYGRRAAFMGRSDGGRRLRARRDGGGRERRGEDGILPHPTAGASCGRGARHGLLHREQRRARRAPCAEAARHRACADRRLGRASRQRDAGHFLRGWQRLLFQHAPVAVVSRHRAAPTKPARARGRGRR